MLLQTVLLQTVSAARVTDSAGEQFHEVLGSGFAGERIDRVVSTVTGVSRKQAVALIADGSVLLNRAAPAKPSLRVADGDELSVSVPRGTELAEDRSVQVPIIFSDEHVIVVEKAAGLVVHPGAGTHSGTLIQGLLAEYPELREVGIDPDRPGVVHRLDKGTSGLLLVARTQIGFDSLTQQLRDRTLERRYRCLVHGDVEGGGGVVDAPIGRSIRQPTRQTVSADGKHAVTHYSVEQRFLESEVTELSCRLETGRTHQIRVHMEAIHYPVVGDERYNDRKNLKNFGLQRPFLHAADVGFEHPVTGETIRFSSDLPPDLHNVLAGLS